MGTQLGVIGLDAASATGCQIEIGPVSPRRAIAPCQVPSGGSAWGLEYIAGDHALTTARFVKLRNP